MAWNAGWQDWGAHQDWSAQDWGFPQQVVPPPKPQLPGRATIQPIKAHHQVQHQVQHQAHQAHQGYQGHQGHQGRPVKRELADPAEREAKIRAMVNKIRGEAAGGGKPAPPMPAPATDAAAEDAEEAPHPPAAGQKAQSPAEIAKVRAQEDEDGKKIEKMLPILEEKVSVAESEVEKVAINAAPLTMDATEDLKVMQLTAVRDTERAYKAAALSFTALKRELDRRKNEAENYAPIAKETAAQELEKLVKRFAEAQEKLDEHKTVRKDYEMAVAAEKLLEELAGRLAGVEMDCEKAYMMTEPLAKAVDTGVEDISTSEIRGTKEAMRVAQATLSPTVRLITGKVTELKGNPKKKLEALKVRGEAAQAMLDKAGKTLEEAMSRVTAAPLVKEAQHRIAAVDASLHKMRETEAPFLMGIETMPATESSEVLAKMEEAAKEAQTSIAEGQKFVSLKMVEVARLASGAASSAKDELERVKSHLDLHLEKVRKFMAETTKRKRLNIVEVIKFKVDEAEAAVKRLKTAGAELSAANAETMTEVLERARAIETEAQASVAAARKELQAKQQELRPAEGGSNPDVLKSSSEILRTKVRVNYTEAELTKFRKLCKEFEEKMKVEQSLADITGTLAEAEAEIDRLTAVSKEWPTDSKPPEEEEANVDEVQGKLSDTVAQVETKLQKAQGMELKELRAVFGRLKQAQNKLDKVKEIAKDRSKHVSKKIVQDAAAAVKKAEDKVQSITRASQGTTQKTVMELETLQGEAALALELLAEANASLNTSQAVELVREAKAEFQRLRMRSSAAEKRGKAAADAIVSRFESAAKKTVDQALGALRSAARLNDGTYDAAGLFEELSEGSGELSESQFCDFFTRRHEAGDTLALREDQAKFAFKRIAPHGLPRQAFAAAIADFLKVVKDITITSDFEIQTAKKLRKLALDEVMEALGASRKDPTLGLERVLCRTISDGITGWVTVKSTSGTCYLERAVKPFMWCRDTVQMREDLDAGSRKSRELHPGEVVELVQGPKEEKIGSDMRVRGVACNEDTSGWLQVKDKSGAILAKLNARVYKCIEGVDMTDVSDLEHSNVTRRIDPGEALELMEAEAVKPEEGGMRRKFRACRDSVKGWVTTHGKEGTVFVKTAAKHFVCMQEAPLLNGLGAESTVVKVLMPGEAFAAFEEPKEVAGGERLTQYRVRAVTDGAEGWITTTAQEEVQAWSSRYKVLRSSPLTKGLALNEATESVEVVRQLEQGELVDASEQPSEDPSSGKLRVRCVALSDKAAGFATVREGGGLGVLMMRPLGAREEAGISDTVGEAAPTTPPHEGNKGAQRGAKRPFEDGQDGKGKGKGGKRQKGGK